VSRLAENPDSFLRRLTASSKACETADASLSNWLPIPLKAPSFGFPSRSRDVREGSNKAAGHVGLQNPMSRRAGGALSGIFSDAPGTGHMKFALHAEGDDIAPGPTSYVPELENKVRPISWGLAKRRLLGEADDTPAFDPKTGKYYIWIYRKAPSLESGAPGPGAYDTTGPRPLREGLQGFAFPLDEYASRYYPTEGAMGSATPGPTDYQRILNPLGNLGMGGPVAGYTIAKAEKVGLAEGGEETPGPPAYRPDVRPLSQHPTGPSFSFPREGLVPQALSGFGGLGGSELGESELEAGSEGLSAKGQSGLAAEVLRGLGPELRAWGPEELRPGRVLESEGLRAEELDDSLDQGLGADQLRGQGAEGLGGQGAEGLKGQGAERPKGSGPKVRSYNTRPKV